MRMEEIFADYEIERTLLGLGINQKPGRVFGALFLKTRAVAKNTYTLNIKL